MKRYQKLFCLFSLIGCLATSAFGQNVVVDRIINANATWTSNNVYELNGYVFVTNGATLTIEPGTTIVSRLPENITSGDPCSALVITNGAMIDAQGTASAPIVFTSIVDQPLGTGGAGDTRLWGGVVILGDAVINSRADDGSVSNPVTDQIEGFSLPDSQQDLITFGGTNDEHNGGIMTYVSIRHGGFDIGGGNEINGLTLGGVGNKTTIHHIEIFAGKDDGVECFGGTVNLSYICVAFNRDDSLDLDQGYRGNVQFFFTIGRFFNDTESDNAPNEGMDFGGEWDGATTPLNATPVADYTIYNGTFIGMGNTGTNGAFHMRDNARITLRNSIATGFETMIKIDDPVDNVIPTIENNLWWSHIPANNTAANLDGGGAINSSSVYESNGNHIADPMLGGISREPGTMVLDPIPQEGSPAWFGAGAVPDDAFFTQTSYRGAFGGENWLLGWTALDLLGYLNRNSGSGPDNEIINVSTRGFVSDGTGEETNVGFVITGSEPANVVVRALGTGALTDFLPGANLLDDPFINVVRNPGSPEQEIIASNDNWADDPNWMLLDGTPLDPVDGNIPLGDNDSSLILLDLAPGNYSIQVIAADGSADLTGIVLAGADALE